MCIVHQSQVKILKLNQLINIIELYLGGRGQKQQTFKLNQGHVMEGNCWDRARACKLGTEGVVYRFDSVRHIIMSDTDNFVSAA